EADLLVVAPATADLMARMAAGMTDDLAATTLLASDKPILIAPAMNALMWAHPATQANLVTLAARGVRRVGPNAGDLAGGEGGSGGMAEPLEIVAAIERCLTEDHRLAGRRALVTSGPTREPIDPVRYVSNHSSGKQGHAIAAALAALGAETVLVSGPTQEPAPAGVRVVPVETAAEMLGACEAVLPVDLAVMAAAGAEWGGGNTAPAPTDKGRTAPPPRAPASQKPPTPPPAPPSAPPPGRPLLSAWRRRPRTSSRTPAASACASAATGSSPTTSRPAPRLSAATATRSTWSM